MAQGSARVAPITDDSAGWFARLVFWLTRRKLKQLSGSARVVGPVRVMAHHPQVLMAYGGFEAGLERCRRLPDGIKALASIRAATLVGCPF